MTCPHCGADASAGQKFCPKCSRLVDSPLLKIKQQIDAAREEIRRDLNAARTVRFSPPPSAADAHSCRGRNITSASRRPTMPSLRRRTNTRRIPRRRPGSRRRRWRSPRERRSSASLEQACSGRRSVTRASRARSTRTRRIASIRSRRRRRPRRRRKAAAAGGPGSRTVQAAGVVHGPRAARPVRRDGDGLQRDAAHHAVCRAAAADHRVLSHPRRRCRIPVRDDRVRHVEAAPVRPLLPAPAAVAVGALGAVRHDLRRRHMALSRLDDHEVVLLGPLAAIAERHGVGVVAHPREGRAGLRVPAVRVRVRPRPRLLHVHHEHAADGDRQRRRGCSRRRSAR